MNGHSVPVRDSSLPRDIPRDKLAPKPRASSGRASSTQRAYARVGVPEETSDAGDSQGGAQMVPLLQPATLELTQMAATVRERDGGDGDGSGGMQVPPVGCPADAATGAVPSLLLAQT